MSDTSLKEKNSQRPLLGRIQQRHTAVVKSGIRNSPCPSAGCFGLWYGRDAYHLLRHCRRLAGGWVHFGTDQPEGDFAQGLQRRVLVQPDVQSTTIYILLFFAAPLIADFYDTPELIPLSRLSFLGFVISSMSIAPRAYLFKNLRIKDTTIISISSLIVSGIVGITSAANGFAYWGIALQSISFVTVMTVLNFYFSRWRPCFRFDFTPIKEMIGFSSKIIITNIFTIINNNLFSVLLGKFYSEREVGNFTQANKWNGMGHTTITGMINGIAQPVFTRVADDKARQLAVFRKLLRFTAFISFPAMLGLSLVSKELIIITITEKWLPSADILQLLCIWGAFIPVINLFSNLLISRGTFFYLYVEHHQLEPAANSSCMCHIPIRVGVDAAYFRHYQYRLAVCMVPFCQEGDRIKTARYAERHLSLSLPIHCTRSVNSLCHSAHRKPILKYGSQNHYGSWALCTRFCGNYNLPSSGKALNSS